MPRILIRAHKHPFTVVGPEDLKRHQFGDNTGNLIFSQAVFRLLSTAGTDLELLAHTNMKSAAAINSGYDHLVIPLANAFRVSFLDKLDALSHLIERLTIPVTVLGVGAQARLDGSYHSSGRVGPHTKRFVRAVLERSPSIGVRGAFTRDYLISLGFADDDVRMIGCPSMFMYGPHLRVERKVEALHRESPIAFNVSPYVKQMGPISRYCAERYPNLIYMAQNWETLELMLTGHYPPNAEVEPRSGVPVSLEHPLIREDRVRFFLDPKTWFDHLAGYYFSFGSRIHGNIAALLAGTPALVLAHDARTLELADYHQIPWREIGDVAADADPVRLYAESDWSLLNAGHPALWQAFADFLAEHGLRQVYEPGQDASAFDARLAETPFPPPVRTLMGLNPEELYAMKRAALSRFPTAAPSSRRMEVWNRIDSAVRRRLT